MKRIPLFLAAIPVLNACAAEDDYDTRPPGGGGNGGGGGGGGGGSDETFRVENDDASGHAHWFEVSCVELDDGKTQWTAQGAHTHTVTLTGDQLEQILAGDIVTVQTSGGHPHTWVFAMPSNAC